MGPLQFITHNKTIPSTTNIRFNYKGHRYAHKDVIAGSFDFSSQFSAGFSSLAELPTSFLLGEADTPDLGDTLAFDAG